MTGPVAATRNGMTKHEVAGKSAAIMLYLQHVLIRQCRAAASDGCTPDSLKDPYARLALAVIMNAIRCMCLPNSLGASHEEQEDAAAFLYGSDVEPWLYYLGLDPGWTRRMIRRTRVALSEVKGVAPAEEGRPA